MCTVLVSIHTAQIKHDKTVGRTENVRQMRPNKRMDMQANDSTLVSV